MFAQLITKGKKQGVHAFYIQIRDRKFHKVLPGITIGDCGPKVGLTSMDNGFVFFKDFRVPKFALLDKLCSIEQDGTYVSPIKDKNKRFATTVSALSSGRILVGYTSAKLNTFVSMIAIRYAHLRTQFSENPAAGAEEKTLIDYQLHQKRLLPHFANGIVNLVVGEKIRKYWGDNPFDPSQYKQNKTQQVCHALTTYLKARATDDGMKAAIESR